MRLVVYEWCCSGGLAGSDEGRLRPGENTSAAFAEPRLLREGRAIFEAVACDAARDPVWSVTVLVDERMQHHGRGEAGGAGPFAGIRLPPSVRQVSVRRGQEIDALVAEANEADWTILVAPETDGLLAARVGMARASGGRVLAPHEAFLAIAADKQATVDALAAAGVAVPAGRVILPHEPVPTGFRMPAVRKARDGAGGDGLAILHAADVAPAPAAARLEAFVAGTPVGVAVLCGPGGLHPLPPMRQRFSGGDAPGYLGSEPLIEAHASNRATELALRSVAAVARTAAIRDPSAAVPCGWVGVDMVIGPREDGSDDRVLEVNPRLTTSFVGLSTGRSGSLVSRLIAIAEGRSDQAADGGDWKPGVPFSIE